MGLQLPDNQDRAGRPGRRPGRGHHPFPERGRARDRERAACAAGLAVARTEVDNLLALARPGQPSS
ncbi:hypothetical protein LP419_03635 [Massilia sp. H-1]|nr:hypothetical protein LP419_03635 [Massilia sp. H-1]